MDRYIFTQKTFNSSEYRFHTLVDHAPDAIFVVNPKGIIVYANKQAIEVFEYSFAEMFGQEIEILVPKVFSNHNHLRQQFFYSPEVRTMGLGLELTGITKNGKVIPVEISLSPYTDNEELMVIATVRDITLRKQAQFEIEKLKEELHSLDHAKAIFLQIISHELRTSLHGIIGFTNMIYEKIESPELLSYFEYLKKLNERLDMFTLNALNITKLRLNQYEIFPEEIFLLELIQSLIKKNDELIKENDLSVRTAIDDTITCFLDKELLSICLNNIITNAIKFSPVGGIIFIESIESDSEIEITITDQGSGFTEESLERRFKLFATEDQHYDENVGLGLALSKMITDTFSGDIKLSNNVNSGACVQVFIPKKHQDKL